MFMNMGELRPTRGTQPRNMSFLKDKEGFQRVSHAVNAFSEAAQEALYLYKSYSHIDYRSWKVAHELVKLLNRFVWDWKGLKRHISQLQTEIKDAGADSQLSDWSILVEKLQCTKDALSKAAHVGLMWKKAAENYAQHVPNDELERVRGVVAEGKREGYWVLASRDGNGEEHYRGKWLDLGADYSAAQDCMDAVVQIGWHYLSYEYRHVDADL